MASVAVSLNWKCSDLALYTRIPLCWILVWDVYDIKWDRVVRCLRCGSEPPCTLFCYFGCGSEHIICLDSAIALIWSSCVLEENSGLPTLMMLCDFYLFFTLFLGQGLSWALYLMSLWPNLVELWLGNTTLTLDCGFTGSWPRLRVSYCLKP